MKRAEVFCANPYFNKQTLPMEEPTLPVEGDLRLSGATARICEGFAKLQSARWKQWPA